MDRWNLLWQPSARVWTAICSKPAEPQELLAAAMEALTRRHNRPTPTEPPAHLLRHGDLVLDLDKRQAARARQPVELAPAEFGLLAHLIENAHRTVPPKELVRVIQGFEPDHQHEARQVVKWYIHLLRARIEPDPAVPPNPQCARRRLYDGID